MIAGASTLVGIPYVEGGDSPSRGFDCWRLVVYVRHVYLGLETPHALEAPAELATMDGRIGALEAARAIPGWRELDLEAARGLAGVGAVVLMSSRGDGRPHHCGVVVDAPGLRVLHAYAPHGRPGQVYCNAFRALLGAFNAITIHQWAR